MVGASVRRVAPMTRHDRPAVPGAGERTSDHRRGSIRHQAGLSSARVALTQVGGSHEMHRTTRTTRRVLLVPVLLLCLMLAGSVPAAAYTPPNETQTGSDRTLRLPRRHGATRAVDCDYRNASPTTCTRSSTSRCRHHGSGGWTPTRSVDNQHGQVGWRIRVQENSDPDDQPRWTDRVHLGHPEAHRLRGRLRQRLQGDLLGTQRSTGRRNRNVCLPRQVHGVLVQVATATSRAPSTHWYQHLRRRSMAPRRCTATASTRSRPRDLAGEEPAAH